jgi:hypothetical protein
MAWKLGCQSYVGLKVRLTVALDQLWNSSGGMSKNLITKLKLA